MTDALVLALTAALTWGMWRALETHGDEWGAWLLALGWGIARELGYD